MKKIILLIFVFVLSGTAAFCDELGALKIYKARLPIYNKNRLKYMIFCDAMTRKADKIYAEEAIIDLIKNNVDVNNMVYLEGVKPYILGTPTAMVADFWKDKTNSLGFISSSKAIILQESKVVSGDKEVFFRSPQLDLNGVGFIANFDTRKIKVLKKVNIIVRMKKKGTKSFKKDIVKVKADSMLMDMEKNLITLSGNVKVDDKTFQIFCDRLELDINKVKDKQDTPKDSKKNSKKNSNDEINPSGVSKISCFGKVKIIRKMTGAEVKKDGSQQAFADKAIYFKSKEQIILTGGNPQIRRGNDMISGDKIILWKDSERLQAFKNCLVETVDKKSLNPKKTELTSDFIDFNYNKNIGIFTGNVRVKNSNLKLNCNKMTVHLQASGKDKGVNSGKKELGKIVCTGSVSANDPRARVNCDRMVITFKDIVLGGKKSEAAISDKREIDLIKCFGNVHMINKPADANTLETVINSDKAFLNIVGNVADLIGNVEIEDSRFDLTCKKMKIFAKDITPEEAAANIAENLENPDDTPRHIGIGDTKELTKIICFEKVVMTRKLSDELQKACGDKAVYIINDHSVVLTGTKSKPTLQRGPTVMEGSKVILWTNSEKLDIEEGTLKNFDASGL